MGGGGVCAGEGGGRKRNNKNKKKTVTRNKIVVLGGEEETPSASEPSYNLSVQEQRKVSLYRRLIMIENHFAPVPLNEDLFPYKLCSAYSQ